tara:strand:- start:214 stop:1086 length:873 start_codon:yes stop_codon:yes gene_type:complete
MSQDMTRWAAECYKMLGDGTGLQWEMHSDVNEEFKRNFISGMQNRLKNSSKFVLPDDAFDLLKDGSQFYDLITSGHRMPYELVCIAYKLKTKVDDLLKMLIYVRSSTEEQDEQDEDSSMMEVLIFYHAYDSHGWYLFPTIWRYNFYGSHLKYNMMSPKQTGFTTGDYGQDRWQNLHNNFTSIIQSCVASLLLLLSCSNVSEQDIPISRLKRDRLKKKKLPVFEHKTLYIEDVRSARVDRGGTSSHKRQHHRRGHIRRLSSGNQVWVRPCLVGDPSLGFVSKDYVLRGGKH